MSTEGKVRTVRGGLFVTFEGIDGSGKSTAASAVADWLRKEGFDVLLIGEPGGTVYGQAARQLFLDNHKDLMPETEVGLLVTAKAQLLQTKIIPHLAYGGIVLCDRYTDTLMAYQHHAKGHSRVMMDRILWAMNATKLPDHTIYFDVTPETSMLRNKKRQEAGGDVNSFDLEGITFRQKLIDGFRYELRQRDGGTGEHCTVVDGEQGVVRVLVEVQKAVLKQLLKKKALP